MSNNYSYCVQNPTPVACDSVTWSNLSSTTQSVFEMNGNIIVIQEVVFDGLKYKYTIQLEKRDDISTMPLSRTKTPGSNALSTGPVIFKLPVKTPSPMEKKRLSFHSEDSQEEEWEVNSNAMWHDLCDEVDCDGACILADPHSISPIKCKK